MPKFIAVLDTDPDWHTYDNPEDALAEADLITHQFPEPELADAQGRLMAIEHGQQYNSLVSIIQINDDGSVEPEFLSRKMLQETRPLDDGGYHVGEQLSGWHVYSNDIHGPAFGPYRSKGSASRAMVKIMKDGAPEGEEAPYAEL